MTAGYGGQPGLPCSAHRMSYLLVVVAVYLDELLQAFIEGIERFREDVEPSPEKAKIVTERAGNVPIYWKRDFLFGAK